jgi:hypothetical protein
MDLRASGCVSAVEEAVRRVGDGILCSARAGSGPLAASRPQAYALRLLGDIAAHRHPPQVEEADATYDQALALADELGMRPLQAHCHFGLGTLHAKAGQWQQTRAELSAAITFDRAMDMTFWLPQAEAVLAQEGQ